MSLQKQVYTMSEKCSLSSSSIYELLSCVKVAKSSFFKISGGNVPLRKSIAFSRMENVSLKNLSCGLKTYIKVTPLSFFCKSHFATWISSPFLCLPVLPLFHITHIM
ncbi:hypothetical protein KsCSTR_09460 [Candidatus Kuenenia stuttgartiensis]|uniref:Uncharacterized protein n=1 Tax=Kuenenia stuttgartiensis TaxID=174633 RepID=Q1PZ05_KUEST|nr:hypothetical protein KsCSTR_09460 [Candidatus Kuenenia stuttgartiensis]CAJ72311.1 unknown protein [Candidatus Kuenenia stuttgartiensis]